MGIWKPSLLFFEKMDIEKIAKETKGIKRIAVVQYLDPRIMRSLPLFERLFRHDYISPEIRREKFREIPGLVLSENVFENITPLAGFGQITKALTGDLPSLLDVTVRYHVLGTGAADPEDGDETLEAEGNRKLVTSKSRLGNKSYYTIVYAESEAVGTWEEMGLVMGGSLTTDTGFLWDRSLYSWTKSNAQAVTFDYEETFVNVEV